MSALLPFGRILLTVVLKSWIFLEAEAVLGVYPGTFGFGFELLEL